MTPYRNLYGDILIDSTGLDFLRSSLNIGEKSISSLSESFYANFRLRGVQDGEVAIRALEDRGSVFVSAEAVEFEGLQSQGSV
jgi:hypothetical protein